MPAVLVVTREPSAQQLVDGALARAGYEVVCVPSAEAAIKATLTVCVSAVVLDSAVGSEEMEALSDWMRNRSDGDVGAVFLISARTRPTTLPIDPDHDQLVVKPFSAEQIRRAVELAVIGANRTPAEKLFLGYLGLDRATRQLRDKDAEVILTPREFQLLEYLALNQGRFVSSQELLEKIWQRDGDSAGVVHITMHKLRSKLSALTNGKELIQTIPRRGYLVPPSQAR